MKKQPLLTKSNKGVHLAVFEQTGKNGGTWLSAKIKRPYKDNDGNWQHGSLSREQLQAVIELASEAIDFIDSRSKDAAADAA